MKKCREFEELIDRAHIGEASEGERETLLDHLELCADCDDIFEAVGRLRSAEIHPEPTGEELLSMRRAVIREIRHERSRKEVRNGFSLASFLTRPAFVGVLAFVMLASGYLLGGGRAPEAGTAGVPAVTATGEDGFASAIKTVAQSHNEYEDIINSPFSYANVRVAEGDAGEVNLSFDVSRHLELSLKRDDPLVTEVLVQSLIQSSGVDTRLNAISIARGAPDPKVKRSLIVAMLNDQNLAVRMTAQLRLVEQIGDPDVSDALLAVLEKEPSVQMRLVAIDYLTSADVQPELLERAIMAGEAEGSEAIFVRATQYLNRSIK